MAVIDSKKTYKNLKKKGFIDSVGHSVDHKYLELYHGGKLILYTKVSHGNKKDLGDFLIKQMSVQCKLDKNELMDLANCPLSQKEYFKILADKGLIKLNEQGDSNIPQ
ncbi:MAG: hypothetical protein RIF36_28120 [Imperialibacter sp.]|uniref:hypothetical protein n=1 Tax=Imperialibacter sp. TaxID=2038411 RepID=UPI0032EEBD36